MSGIFKKACEMSLFKTVSFIKSTVHRDLVRSLSILSHKTNSTKFHHLARCVCGNNLSNVHNFGGVQLSKSQGFSDKRSSEAYNSEKELSQFLVEEIEAEKKLQKGAIPTQLGDFSVKLEGSEVVLSKKLGDEVIQVCFNVNHTVDSEDGDAAGSDATSHEMKSRPNFEVEVLRAGKTLGFSCSMIPPPAPGGGNMQDQEAYNDLFSIDEVMIYSGEWKDTNYSAGGDVLDGTLYDMFMDLLEDKGINNEFIEQLTEFSTKYEHSRYINMLEDIQKFCGSK